jgi:hypothetical protein
MNPTLLLFVSCACSCSAIHAQNHICLDFIPKVERIERLKLGIPSVTPPAGVYAVEGHGTPDALYCKQGRPMDAREIAGWITHDSRFKTGTTVYLFACETGKGNHPIAQDLANVLRTPVIAPTDKLWPLTTGAYIVAGGRSKADLSQLGMMRRFLPNPKR